MFTDVDADDATISRNGDDIVITLSNGETVTLANQLSSDNILVEFIEFRDGEEWNTTDIIAKVLESAGTADSDTIEGFNTNDTINGLAGDDALYGHEGNDVLDGGDGNDTLDGGLGDDTHRGGAGDDLLIGNIGADSFDGGTGNDTIDFSYSDWNANFDLASGEVAFIGGITETITSIENAIGTAGDNIMNGSAEANRLEGHNGDDTLDGRAGNDTLDGGLGDDTHRGGAGDDLLIGNIGADSFDGGTGNDTIDFSYSDWNANFDLASGEVAFIGGITETITSIENAIGTTGNNIMNGSAEANRLEGHNGDDTLNGRAGADHLTGGNGADTFEFRRGDGADTITDFTDGTDSIEFDIENLTFADLTITDDDDDVIINYGGTDSIRLEGVQSEELSASDFAFA